VVKKLCITLCTLPTVRQVRGKKQKALAFSVVLKKAYKVSHDCGPLIAVETSKTNNSVTSQWLKTFAFLRELCGKKENLKG
jgi:hypothetical protein